MTGYAAAAFLFLAANLSLPFAVSADQAKTPAAAPASGADQTPGADQSGVGTTSPTPSADAQIQPPVTLSVTDGAKAPQTLTVSGPTVADALKQAGVVVNSTDKVSPPLSAPVSATTPIVIKRIRYQTQTENCPLPFHSVMKMSRAVPPGKTRAGHGGTPGVVTKTFEATYVNDKLLSRKLLSKKVTKAPVNDVTLAGIRVREARALPSRGGSYQRLRSMTMVATGYSPYEGSGAGRCATGMRAGYGVVAVDPRVIPLGSKLYIEGYGYAVAGDTGGAIKGNRIDLGHTTYREAARVGRRRVKVWVLSPSR